SEPSALGGRLPTMETPPNPKQHDVMVIIDEQSRSNGNTTSDGIRFRFGNVHGWHMAPTHEQMRACLARLISAELVVRDGFGEGGPHYALTHAGVQKLTEVKDARARAA
ncbi:MAG: hypothetical protein M3355_05225, partial [Actinomycetota bacterium]|nr:hypothetical protein [Actinomycetota bacterium]